MGKKKLFNIIAILLGVITVFGFSSVKATNFDTGITRESLTAYTSINFDTRNTTSETLKLIDSGYSYVDGPEKKIWKIINEDLANNIYYCLNMTRGFNGMAENSTDVYTYKQELSKQNLDTYSGLNLSNDTYNKILWILDNSYVPTNSQNIYNEDAYKLLMKKAGIEIYSDNTYNLTEEDILTAQKLAIWHHTNNFISIRSIDGVPSDDLKGQYGEVIAKSRKNKIIDLYNYLVDNAQADYKWENPIIKLEETAIKIEEIEDEYIVGPYYLTAENMPEIKTIDVTCSKEYTLLNSSKKVVKNNDFLEVINKDNFYLKFDKTQITKSTTIEVNIEYKFDEKNLIFMTNTSEADSTQPVVNVKSFEVGNTAIIEIPITLTQISVEKIWEDAENQDNVRPSSVKVQLYKNNKVYGDSIILNKTNNWKKTWNNLLDGYTYTVKELNGSEEPIIDGGKYNKDYTVKYEISNNKTTITNTHTPDLINISGIKTWEDNNNQDGKRPESIAINLLANGEKIKAIQVRPEDDWKYEFKNLPKYEDGEEIVYTITEDKVEGYTTKIEGYDIINKYIPEEIEKTITKIWNDNNNQDGKRAEYGVTLKANGNLYGEEIILNEETLTYTWKNLPKYANGEEIVYTVEETTIPNEYSATYSEDTFTITNTYTPGKINLKVIKVWDDQDDKDKIRPEKVSVKLYKTINNEKEEVGSHELDKSNNWMYTWTGLDEKYNGEKIIYSIEEGAVEKYTTTYSSQDFSNTNEITITNSYTPVVITGKYNVVLRKVDENGNILNGSKFEVSGTEYDLSKGEILMYENQEITEENLLNGIDFMYMLEETQVPAGYNGIKNTEVNIKAKVEKVDANYKLVSANLVDSEGKNITDENISIKLEGESIVIEVKNTPIEKKFDLALRKFITKVNDTEYSREPIVDTSKLGTIVNEKVVTTATYKHIKTPIVVQKGDIVTYTIRVYNEGELDGYVDLITDHLPDNLLPIIEGIDGINSEKYAEEIEFNSNWLWEMSPNADNSVMTTVTSKSDVETYSILTGLEEVVDTKLDAYVEGSNKLDYIDVQLKCLVSENATNGEYLTNIAEIIDSQDVNGVKGDGLDSTLNNVEYSNLSDYKNSEAIGSIKDSYIKGQEDDDDFEKLIVQEFDLALRKFITKVNDVTYSREPVVDTSKLGTVVNGKVVSTATYNHSKQPVIVKTDDIVTYTIRIYNEGALEGFANEITDDIPEGLEFLPDSAINTLYKWEMLDKDGNKTTEVSKSVMIITKYLSDSDKNNIINPVSEENGKKVLSYKDVEVQFKVIAKPQKLQENIIINEAQISADSDRDIDSIPNRNEKYNYTSGNNEDDIDYEPIKLQYFDLALRKFITKVNGINYNNRYPEIKFNNDGSITYSHTKDPVLVTTGDIVTYTIRVYNEGEISGYVTEIKDNLPEGLAFDPNNEINKLYGWKMIDSQGSVTEDAQKVVAFNTEYLKNELIEPLEVENGIKMLSYKDVQIAFKVTESMLSDKILVNTAEILNDSDDDIDSIPGNNILVEDDIDKEYVKVQYFDLSLKKWVTKTQVTLDGKTTTTKTGFKEDSDEIAKVDLVASKMKKTTVKFTYSIKVTNEGELPGYVYEVKDYIPKGLKFIAEDNIDWTEQKDGSVITEKLKDTLLNPGESATVEIVLTWKNSSTNTGLKTNYAEISKDSAEDIDSMPDNYDFTEDDIDDAQVIISIKTAGATTYIGFILLTVTILAGGIFLIKKYVLV